IDRCALAKKSGSDVIRRGSRSSAQRVEEKKGQEGSRQADFLNAIFKETSTSREKFGLSVGVGSEFGADCQQEFDKTVNIGVESKRDGVTCEEEPLASLIAVPAGTIGATSHVDLEGVRGVFVEDDPIDVQNNNFQMVESSSSESLDLSSDGQIKSPFPYIQNSKAKSKSLVTHMGTPKCFQIIEAAKGGKSRVRKKKGNNGSEKGNDVGGQQQSNEEVDESRVESRIAVEFDSSCRTPLPSSSGVDLLLMEDGSKTPISPESLVYGEVLLQNEAAKLLEIQKTVGFTFEVEDRDVCEKMVEDELRDRAQKVERETVNGDQ
ncbi:hypothetical protein A2U01_0002328, partial [Trifolium medium]|nr:hypothetical protein [Trifolium medium]